jgi:hypothetical protein
MARFRVAAEPASVFIISVPCSTSKAAPVPCDCAPDNTSGPAPDFVIDRPVELSSAPESVSVPELCCVIATLLAVTIGVAIV